jgi:hypothetical protein
MPARVTILSLLACIMLAGGARAEAALNDLGSIPWGASEQVLQTTVSTEACIDTTNPAWGDRLCVGNFQVGKVPVRGYFWLRSHQLFRVSFVFRSSAFLRVAEAFDAQYGPVTRRRFERISISPLTFTSEVREWLGSPISGGISQYHYGFEGDSQAWLEFNPGGSGSDTALAHVPPAAVRGRKDR